MKYGILYLYFPENLSADKKETYLNTVYPGVKKFFSAAGYEVLILMTHDKSKHGFQQI